MTTRRTFLAAAAVAPLALVGCRRDPAAALVSSADFARMAEEKAAREAHLAALVAGKVPPTAVRTTPPRPVDLAELFPELKGFRRATVRLHPRFSDESPATASKLGGQFLWPADEPWPECQVFKIPYVPVLQLRADDAPTQVKYPPGTDLLQLLWSPREHPDLGGPKPLVRWRKQSDVLSPFAAPPITTYALPGYVPVPCRLFPEQVLELPDWQTVRVTPLREKVQGWTPPGGGDPVDAYTRQLSVAPGTKAGGYPWWVGEATPPACDTCHRGMDFLLTIDTDEWREPTWIPIEEADSPELRSTAANAPGLTLSGNYHLYVCRRCADWPVRAV